MNRIYIIIAGAFLILLVVISILLSLGKKSATNTQTDSLFPTSVPLQESTKQVNTNSSNESNVSNESNSSDSPIDISTIAPVETTDFKMQFSTQLNKLIVEKKTPEAEQKFADWAKQNNYSQLINNPDKVLLAESGQAADQFNPMLTFFSIFMTFGQTTGSATQSPSPTVNPSVSPSSAPANNSKKSNNSSSKSSSAKFTYFAQCGDQGSLPLPDGGTLCTAGCGPTSVAMIASSYVDKKYDPRAIVDLYESSHYLLGNSGSRYTDANTLLKSIGLKTTDYITFNYEKSDTVVPQLKKYLASGWTFFTLASFCDGGCGHYFWITDIDSKGNIIAYDPAYGRYQIPYNENGRYPFPLYRLAFGVKK